MRLWRLFHALSCLGLVHAGCEHEDGAGVHLPSAEDGQVLDGKYVLLQEGSAVSSNVHLGKQKLYLYENANTTTMNQPERYRKVIISLEPCEGVVYLFVRKTRRCWPDPATCCKPIPGRALTSAPPPCNSSTHEAQCTWSHFHSIIDGTRDGAPTFFEVPHNSAKYFISVYAPSEVNLNYGVSNVKYRLTVLADIGAYPRPGLGGRLYTKFDPEAHAVEVSWEEAAFIPIGVSSLRSYYLYSSLLLAGDTRQHESVFLNPAKVMNAVCGLERNAVKYGSAIAPASCQEGTCRAIIAGIVPKRRYMFNVIAESYRGYNSTYSGIIVSSDATPSRHAFSNWSETATSLVGALCGTVFGVLLMGYLWIVKLYK